MDFYISENDTDNDSYSSTDYEYNIDDVEDYMLYEPEEPSITKYNIVICEKFNEELHGRSDGEINDHNLVHYRFRVFALHSIQYLLAYHSNWRLEIAECIYLPSLHCVPIIKTYWIRLIQRKWKNIMAARKAIIQKRYCASSLIYREMHGKWSADCSFYPVLKGMLNNI